MAVDITRQRAQLEHARFLADELNHRVKNTLQTVQALAAQSLRKAGLDETLYADFIGRIQALSNVQNLLTAGRWQRTELRDVLQTALMPFGFDCKGAASRFACEGPSVPLSAQRAQAFSMALHELATNAVKYRSLSNARGSVAVRWSYDKAKEALALTWQERDGPPVSAPTREGFGTLMLTRILAGDIDGTITIEYPEEGAVCKISGRVPA